MTRILIAVLVAAGTGVFGTSMAAAADQSVRKTAGINQIENVVVIYAENRSFDNLYGFFSWCERPPANYRENSPAA